MIDSNTYDDIFEEIQDPNSYQQRIPELRKEKQLHDFCEMRLQELLHSLDYPLHTQSEKWGISNGRIDVAAYSQTRIAIHYEIIASNSNQHVFRDTTSLLVSRADTKLAVLIDRDIADGVKVNNAFFAAVPHGEIEFTWLRTILLKDSEESAKDLLVRLLDDAQFISGSLKTDGFRCKLSTYNLLPLHEVDLSYENAEPDSALRVQIRTPDEIIPIKSFKTNRTGGAFTLTVPWRSRFTRGDYRIEVYQNNEERWATWIQVPKTLPSPTIDFEKEIYETGASARFLIKNFGSNRKVFIFIRQSKGAGSGIYEGVTDNNGKLTDTFEIPSLKGDRLIESGNYELSISSDGVLIRTYLQLVEAKKSEMSLQDSSWSFTVGLVSLSISNLTIRPGEIELCLEILHEFQDPILFHSLRATISINSPELPIAHLQSELNHKGETIHPGEILKRSVKLFLLHGINMGEDDVNSEKRPSLWVSLNAKKGNHMVGLNHSVGIPIPRKPFLELFMDGQSIKKRG